MQAIVVHLKRWQIISTCRQILPCVNLQLKSLRGVRHPKQHPQHRILPYLYSLPTASTTLGGGGAGGEVRRRFGRSAECMIYDNLFEDIITAQAQNFRLPYLRSNSRLGYVHARAIAAGRSNRGLRQKLAEKGVRRRRGRYLGLMYEER